jgi:uncharacterized protein YkwD
MSCEFRLLIPLLLLATARAHADFLDCLFEGDFDANGTTNAEASAAIQLHNCARRTVEPAAATPIKPLSWNTSIASMAQSYANQCHFAHSDNADYGENIYAVASRAPALRDAVAAWAGEEPNYNYATNACRAGKVCGHYTQVVWSGTSEVGCGKTYCTKNSPFGGFPKWYLIVCNYAPAGNDGRRPY